MDGWFIVLNYLKSLIIVRVVFLCLKSNYSKAKKAKEGKKK